MVLVQDTIATLAGIQGAGGFAIIDAIQGGSGNASYGIAMGTAFVVPIAGTILRYSWKLGSQSVERIARYIPGGIEALRGVSRSVGRPVNLYRYLSGKLISGWEANHLLPKALFRAIPEDDILAVAM